MGKAEKKTNKHRSRSSSRERSRKREKRRSRSRSPDRKQKKKDRQRSRSRSSSPRQDKRQRRSRSREDRSRDRSGSKRRGRSRSRSKEATKKKHKRKSRSRSDSRGRGSSRSGGSSEESGSESDSAADARIDRRRREMQQDKEKTKEEKKKQKEMMKLYETPEEKRARRLAKKEAKARKARENMGWDQEYMGYTNTDNPFGDANLLDTFVWSKKHEKEGTAHLLKEEQERIQKRKQLEMKNELVKVKQARLERERERQQREEEMEAMQRAKEAEYYKEWEQQEDNFHLHQAKLRSKIRIQDGRAKPIDLLAKYISAEDDDIAVEMHEPYTFLTGLTMTDLEDLAEDIKVYMELEQGKNADFWKDMTVIAEDELSKLKKLEQTQRGESGVDRREGINASVSTDVVDIFHGKTFGQLVALQQQIMKRIKSGDAVDIGYWESLLQQLKAHMARARLRDRHQETLRRKLFQLKQEQGVESQPLFPISVKQEDDSEEEEEEMEEAGTSADVTSSQPEQEPESEPQPGPSCAPDGDTEEKKQEENTEEETKEPEAVLTEEDLMEQSYDDYNAGRYSPKRLRTRDLPPDCLVFDPADDLRRLDIARRKVAASGTAEEETEDDQLMKKAREGMTTDEATFSVQVPLQQKVYLWSDKYRPRKPRFFNRVHTGFEWNKYNQTHYDFDNPPPKIVQGYKFNIFYPDLIDKTQTPEYTLTPEEGKKDFASLRFHAGPPYEDIAFRIVNREWEYSHRHGFRCQFSNGIFQLWFHFKRYRYRR
ncbi:CACTIN [Branchiostoma lanceolatum]|uniref:Splicing factor Cactin n=1 Tax=Branchiostoma lanceolatum TaxID=7740 RepID=A0A8J9ZGR2_BRALA|nr:CACTIN [Branchiostoma lanceolatum]